MLNFLALKYCYYHKPYFTVNKWNILSTWMQYYYYLHRNSEMFYYVSL